MEWRIWQRTPERMQPPEGTRVLKQRKTIRPVLLKKRYFSIFTLKKWQKGRIQRLKRLEKRVLG